MLCSARNLVGAYTCRRETRKVLQAHQHTSLRKRSATTSTMMSSLRQLRDCETPELDMPEFTSQNTELRTTPGPRVPIAPARLQRKGHYLPRALARLARSLLHPAGRPRRYGSSGALTFPPPATTSVTQPELRPPPQPPSRRKWSPDAPTPICAGHRVGDCTPPTASFSPFALGRTARRALPATMFSQATGTLRPRVVGVLPAPMPFLRYPWLPRYRRPGVCLRVGPRNL